MADAGAGRQAMTAAVDGERVVVDKQRRQEHLEKGAECVLLDIEGTICPISFVKDTLFPYALNALPDVLAAKWDDEDFHPYRVAFPEEARSSPETLQAYVEQLTRDDVKVACHKNLQGYLWENGYKSGAYSTPLFLDVAPQLKEWSERGLMLAIYSSGSVFAQKLLFGHVQVESPASNGQQSEGVVAGPHNEASKKSAAIEDLRHLISDWFDTTNAGSKKEPSSYTKIAESLQYSPSQILFLTDSPEEYDAATTAGMTAGLLMRPGNSHVDSKDVDRMETFFSLDDADELTSGWR